MIQGSLYSDMFQHDQCHLQGVHAKFKTINIKMVYIYEIKNCHVN